VIDSRYGDGEAAEAERRRIESARAAMANMAASRPLIDYVAPEPPDEPPAPRVRTNGHATMIAVDGSVMAPSAPTICSCGRQVR
jgi:hypothetical protein